MTDRHENAHENEYYPAFLAMLQQTWGEGFLSPGGRDEVAAILRGVDVTGRVVLDIGSGLGGPAFTLVQGHAAGRVVGIDVEAPLVSEARATLDRLGLADRIEFRLVEPGPLPFDDDDFDVVFSKDSIIHVPYKAAFYADVHRVLKPGGALAISDWFCGTEPFTPEMDAWLELTGLSFAFAPIGDCARTVEQAGFVGVETEDRNAWFAGHARRDVEQLEQGLHERLAGVIGRAKADEWLERCRRRLVVAEQGQLRPGHVRARKAG